MSSTSSDHSTSDSPQHPGAWTFDGALAAPPPSLAGDDNLPTYSELPASEPTATNGYAADSGTAVTAGVKGSSGAHPQGPREQPSTTTDSPIPTNAAAVNVLSQAAGVSTRLLGLSQTAAPVPHRSDFGPAEQSSTQSPGLQSDGTPSTARVPHTSVFGPAEQNSDQRTTESTVPVPHKSVFGPAEQNADNKATIPIGSQSPVSGGLITSPPIPQPAPTTSAYSSGKGRVPVIEEPVTAHAADNSERKTFWQWFKGWKVWAACGACCELTCACLEGCSGSGCGELCGDAFEVGQELCS